MKLFSRNKGKQQESITAKVQPRLSVPLVPAPIPDNMTLGDLHARVYDKEVDMQAQKTAMMAPKEISGDRFMSWANLSSYQRDGLQVPIQLKASGTTPIT